MKVKNVAQVILAFAGIDFSDFLNAMSATGDTIHELGELFAVFTDVRKGKNCHYTMRDIVMSGFSLFHMQCPSFLHFQRKVLEQKGRSNCQTLYGMKDIPTDNHKPSVVPLDKLNPSVLSSIGIVLICQFFKTETNGGQCVGIDAINRNQDTLHCFGSP